MGTGFRMMALARTGVSGGQKEEEKIMVCAGSEVVLVETEETGKRREKESPEPPKRKQNRSESGTGAGIRQFKVVTETGAVVRVSGW